MKLPQLLLGTLAAAVAGLGLAGCHKCPSSPPSEQVSPTSTSVPDPDCGPDGCQVPNNQGGFRDPCPACGRG